ncbi:MAG: hypothetical protein EBQ56_03775 [Proteobacteria bacterium]|nr:hypothetical protein [Pseudomonadota bacterium]
MPRPRGALPDAPARLNGGASCGRGGLPAAGTDTLMTGTQSPQRFGDYELIGRLGSGGFGTVWKAREVSLGRIVALKVRGANLTVAEPAAMMQVLAGGATGCNRSGQRHGTGRPTRSGTR